MNTQSVGLQKRFVGLENSFVGLHEHLKRPFSPRSENSYYSLLLFKSNPFGVEGKKRAGRLCRRGLPCLRQEPKTAIRQLGSETATRRGIGSVSFF